MTVKEALKRSAEVLKRITDEAENEAKLIVSHLVGEDIGRLMITDKTVDETELSDILKKRSENIPLQYIFGKWWFYKGEFFVGEGVLIPRQDTETLVEAAIELLKYKPDAIVADLCAGSGCIGISIAADYPKASVTCVEKYEEAFSYLEKNIKHNGTENVKAILADVCERSFGEYDLIISNPPYITAEDMRFLSEDVKREPETALFGGEDGLYFYRTITRLWKSALNKNGVLAYEVGIGEAEQVADIMKQEGFSQITTKKDLCGVHRVVFGTAKNI